MVEKITKNLLNKIINEIKKEENQKKIEIEILNPLLIKFSNKIYPYIKIGFLVYTINFIILIIIFILILIIYNYKKNLL